MRVFFAILVFCCWPFSKAMPQTFPLKTFPMESLTIDDGLSQGMINWIAQDYLGFMWIATKDGLNRYDGSHFVVYRHNPADTRTLAENMVSYIFEDSKKRLWIATASNGLDLFDRDSETFTHFTHDEKNKQSLAGAKVNALAEDLDGNLYVSTNAGLCLVNETTAANGKPGFSFTVIDGHPYCKVFATKKGQIWVSPANDSVYTLTKTDGGITKKSMPLSISHTTGGRKFTKEVLSFAYDKAHGLLYMILPDGLLRYNEKQDNWKQMPGLPINSDELSYSSFIYSTGTIWIAANDRILLYDTSAHATFQLATGNEKMAQMLAHPHHFMKDRSGNVWIGTKGYGILKYNSRAEKFHHTDTESIVGMTENNDGHVIILKHNQLAGLFDKGTNSYTGLLPQIEKGIKTSNIHVLAAQQDHTGNYWLACDNLPFMLFNNKSKTAATLHVPPSNYFPIYKSLQGNIWACTSDSAICFDTNGKNIASYGFPIQNNISFYAFIQAIHQQNDSIFWMASTNGLLRLNKNTRSWKTYQNDPADAASLSSNMAFSLCADPAQPEKYLWVGTNGSGLNRLDIDAGLFTRYTAKDGLPNDVVYGILTDNDGHLWISTNNGLSKFSPSQQSFQNFEAKDGLQGNEFNRYAYCKTKDGTLFFGGINGFNYFNPQEIGKNALPPNIVITALKIGNKPVAIDDDKKILTKSIGMTERIVLNHSDNMISFDFIALDFTQPSKNQYQYKMEGFDKEWIHAGTVHAATYTNLDPGQYSFKVKGSNSDGVWNENGASIQLTILPPWWATWWFRSLLLLAIGMAAYSFYRYRLRQALQVQAIRNKIASDLHDEIGSNLSSISIFSHVGKEQSEGQPVAQVLQKISSYAQQSMEAMGDIVWMINATNDRFENIIDRMRELAVELLEAKKIGLVLDINDRLNQIKLGMQERKNFWLIYKEALNNAAKYAEADKVFISLQLENGWVMLQVKDDGIGFDAGKPGVGNGLKNMRQRALLLKGLFSITSAPGNGTSIELKFKV